MTCFITIILTTCHRPMALAKTLESLKQVEIPVGWAVELILVENATSCSVTSVLHEFEQGGLMPIRYLLEPAQGKSQALNRALREATGDILLFTDDDVRFPPNWIEGMCGMIVDNRADAVAGGVRLAPDLQRSWMNHTHRAWLASTADYLARESPSEMCGANMAIRRSVLDRIGGFDTEVGPGITNGGEESLVSWQILKMGYRLVSALDVEVEHHLDPRRLTYASWVRAAGLKGETRAYQLHHWFHRSLRHPSLRKAYLTAKLYLRRLLSSPRKADDEGIVPWELSYLEEISMCARYLHEQTRPRNYTTEGFHRAKAGSPALVS